jgi:hypothetical protein
MSSVREMEEGARGTDEGAGGPARREMGSRDERASGTGKRWGRRECITIHKSEVRSSVLLEEAGK